MVAISAEAQYAPIFKTQKSKALSRFQVHHPTVVLVNSEVTDKLRIVILSSFLLCAYNFGSACNSPGIIPEPNGATG
jgi:hypothetical protein